MKKVRITFCTFQIANFFTLQRREVLGKRRNTKLDEVKVTVKKMSNRAGATPLFRLSAAQKVRGVAPALRHGKPCLFFSRAQRFRRQHT